MEREAGTQTNTEPVPVDTALYLRADELVGESPGPAPGGLSWPLYRRDGRVAHDQLMPLLYTGVVWQLGVQGWIALEPGSGSVLVRPLEELARQVGGMDEAVQRALSKEAPLPELLRIHSYRYDLAVAFTRRAEAVSGASDRDEVELSELAGWGSIHELRCRRRGRLKVHDELERRGVLARPDDWEGRGLRGAFKRFTRSLGGGQGRPEPRADELIPDGGALTVLEPDAERIVAEFRAWQAAEPELAAAVRQGCIDGFTARTPYATAEHDPIL